MSRKVIVNIVIAIAIFAIGGFLSKMVGMTTGGVPAILFTIWAVYEAGKAEKKRGWIIFAVLSGLVAMGGLCQFFGIWT